MRIRLSKNNLHLHEYLVRFVRSLWIERSNSLSIQLFMVGAILILLPNITTAQTTYTWNGTQSTVWSNNLNWTPNTGFPGAIDNAVIVNSAFFQPSLDIARAVNNLTINSGVLDLSGYTFSVYGNSSINAGAVNNGTLLITAATSTTFGSAAGFPVIGASVYATTASITLRNTTFQDTLVITKTGISTDLSTGNNTFNGITSISNSGNGQIVFANTTRDIFNGDVSFSNSGTNIIYIAYSDISGTQFNGNITIENTNTGSIRFGQNTGTSILATGKTISIGAGGYTGGQLRLRNFTQLGGGTIALNLTGTAIFYLQLGSTFNAGVVFTAPQLYLDGATYNGTATLEKTGAVANASVGGNTFNSDVIATNSGSGYLRFNTGGSDVYNGNLLLSSTNTGGFQFGQGTGTCTLAAGNTISVGSAGYLSSGGLYLRNFIQLGTTPQMLLMTGTTLLDLQTGTIFNGDVNFSTPQLLLDGARYNGNAILEKSGAVSNAGVGGNIFNQNLTVSNSGSGYLRFNGTGSDQYNGNIVINSTGAGGVQFGQNAGTNTLANGKTITIGASGFNSTGALCLRNFTQTGSTPQVLTLTGTAALYLQNGTVFNGGVQFIAPQIYFNGATFNDVGIFQKTGATNNAGLGGCTFNATATITNSGSGYLMFGNGAADHFNGDVHLTNSGTSTIYIGYSVANTLINADIYLNSSSGSGIQFGASTGTVSLATGKNMYIGSGGFTVGTLLLRNFIQNGATPQLLLLNGATASLTIGPNTTFNGDVNFTAPQITLNGATYNGVTQLTKTGAASNSGTGGNIFNQDLIVKITGSGYLRFNGNSNDQYNGNIILNSIAGGGIHFGQNTGTCTLATGKTISIGSSGFINAGSLYIRNFTQTGSTPQMLSLGGTATLYLQTGTVFNGDINFMTPQLFLNGSTFNGNTIIEKTGAGSNNSNGGNVFNGTTSIINSGTGYLLTSLTIGDVYNAPLTLTNSGSGYLRLAYAGSSQYNENILLNNTAGAGLYFCESTGTATLATGKTIAVGSTGFSVGEVRLRNFMQVGGTSQSLYLTGTAGIRFQTGSIFNADLNFSAPQMFIDGGIFNGVTTLEKTGATNNISIGNATFNQTTEIQNSGSGILYLSNTTADDYNGDVTFIQTGSGALYPAYNTNCTFASSISTVGTSTALTFGNANGRVTLNGTLPQAINGSTLKSPIFRRVTMAASAAATTLNVPVTVSLDLTLTTGKIISSLGNVLTLTSAAVTTIGNSSSYVDGPMINTVAFSGSSTRYFPLGKDGDWRPLVLSTTHSNATSVTYTAEMTNSSAEALGYIYPPSIDKVSSVRYWKIDRQNVANFTSATVQLNYGVDDGVSDISNLRVLKNNLPAAGNWYDVGGTGAASPFGSITSTGVPTAFNTFSSAATNYFTLGNFIGGANALPVDLIRFDANCTSGKVELRWSTASEQNNNYFMLTKSIAGQPNQFVVNVTGAGNSNSVNQYSYIDLQLSDAIVYYHLSQKDFNGFTHPLAVASADCGSGLELSISPNPGNGQFNFIGINGSATITIRDITGKVISEQETMETSTSVDLSLQPNGIYFAQITKGNSSVTKKIFLIR